MANVTKRIITDETGQDIVTQLMAQNEFLVALHGNRANLQTEDKTSLVAAVNELVGKLGTVGDLETVTKTSVVGAVNELNTTKAKVSSGVILYVAPDGNDTTGDGTNAHPFATLDKAINSLGDILSPNATIRLKAGTYNWTFDFSNRAACYYLYRIGSLNIYGDENAIININISIPSSATASDYRLFFITQCHVYIQDLNLNINLSSEQTSNYTFSIFQLMKDVNLRLDFCRIVVNAPKCIIFDCHSGLTFSRLNTIGFVDRVDKNYTVNRAIQGGTISQNAPTEVSHL